MIGIMIALGLLLFATVVFATQHGSQAGVALGAGLAAFLALLVPEMAGPAIANFTITFLVLWGIYSVAAVAAWRATRAKESRLLGLGVGLGLGIPLTAAAPLLIAALTCEFTGSCL